MGEEEDMNQGNLGDLGIPAEHGANAPLCRNLLLRCGGKYRAYSGVASLVRKAVSRGCSRRVVPEDYEGGGCGFNGLLDGFERDEEPDPSRPLFPDCWPWLSPPIQSVETVSGTPREQ
jgi:hypothetical protein